MLKSFAAALLCSVLATPALAQSIKKMDAGLDTGAILSEERTWLRPVTAV